MEYLRTLAKLDLNLLTAFAVLDKTRSVTAAAKTLGLTQPAMSHILARLRSSLGDPLFVKTTKEMVPTPKASQMAPFIHDILQRIEGSILNSSAFNPQDLDRTFHIKTTDYIEALIMPGLLSQTEREAPRARISVTSPEFHLPKEKLERGSCDVAIAGFFGDLPDGFYQQKLFDDELHCVVAADHPRLGKKSQVSLQDYCGERHLLIAPGGDLQSKLDRLLLEQKRQRLVVAGCSNFLVSGWAVSNCQSILTAPLRLLNLLSAKFDLKMFALPLKYPPISVVQVWHERSHHDAAHKWFRNLIAQQLR